MASDTAGLAGIAARYATALYELAEEDKALDEVARDLEDLKAMIAESADLSRLLRSPLIDRADQAAAMETILKRAKAQDLTRRMVGIAARNRRLFALPAVIDAYLALLAQRRGEVTARVTSATALSETQLKAITAALRKVVGAKVLVDPSVDPALLGGFVVRVGSRMFDSSIRTKLQRMRLAMKGAQ